MEDRKKREKERIKHSEQRAKKRPSESPTPLHVTSG